MPKIGTLANAASQTFDLSYLPQFIQIAEPDLDFNITSLNIQARGRSIINLSAAAQIETLFKLENQVIAAGASTDLARRLMLAMGRIEGQTTITAVNSAATTPDVFANSLGKNTLNNMARSVAVSPVVASGNNGFKNFDVIYMLPTNVERVDVQYANDFVESLTPEELAGNYAATHPSEADGYVNGFVVIDGYRATIPEFRVVRATVYAKAGGNVDVVVCNWQNI